MRAQEVADYLESKGIPVQRVRESRDPLLEDGLVSLTDTAYVQVGAQDRYFSLNIEHIDGDDFTIEFGRIRHALGELAQEIQQKLGL